MVPSANLALTVLKGSGQGNQVELSGTMAVGSNRSSDLHLRDASVSWNHARVWTEDGQCFVEDLGSANGTRVNGDTIQKSALQPGDLLAIGNSVLGLHAVNDPAPVLGGQGAPGNLAGGAVNGHAERAPNPSRKRLSLLDQLDLAKSKNDTLEARAADLEARNLELNSQLKTIEKRASRLDKKCGELEKAGQSASVGSKELETELATLRANKASREKEIARLKRKVEALSTDFANDKSSAEKRYRDEAEARQRLDSEADEIRTRLAEAQKSAKKENRARLSQESEMLQLRQRQETSDERETALRESILELERDQSMAQGELSVLQEAGERFEAERKRYENSALEADRRLEVLRESSEKKLNDLRGAQHAEARSYREEIEAMSREHRRELLELDEKAAQRLAEKEADFESTLDQALTRERGLVEREMDRSGGQLNRLVAEFEKLREERQRLSEELQQKIRGITRIEEELRLKVAECESQSGLLLEKDDRLAGLESELRGLREEVSASRKSGAAAEERAVLAEQALRIETERSVELAAWADKAGKELGELEERSRELEQSREDAVAVQVARDAELRAEIDGLQSQLTTAERLYRDEQRKGDDLVSERARLETELGMVRGYVRELKDKLRDRDRESQQLRARLRDHSASTDGEART